MPRLISNQCVSLPILADATIVATGTFDDTVTTSRSHAARPAVQAPLLGNEVTKRGDPQMFAAALNTARRAILNDSSHHFRRHRLQILSRVDHFDGIDLSMHKLDSAKIPQKH